MRNFISVVFFVFLFSASEAQSSKIDTITIKTNIHCDHCLECGSCGLNINEAVLRTKGVKKVTVKPENNTITVVYKTKRISAEEIRRTIAAIGFDADDVNAEAEGYSRLDNCCKPD